MPADNPTPPADARAARSRELAGNLAAVRDAVSVACERAARDPDGVTIVAVTKGFPASDVALLAELGITDFGENRDQEARAKVSEVDRFLGGPSGAGAPRWHLVGQLQTNKAASVARYASVVHSVDRPRLVTALSQAMRAATAPLRCLVQVRLDRDSGGHAAGYDAGHDAGARGGAGGGARGGATPDEAVDLADAVARAPGLDLGGVMAVAPVGADPDAAFERLARVAARVRRNHPSADWISAGMSEDFTAAIARGATHVRLGRALLGERPSLR